MTCVALGVLRIGTTVAIDVWMAPEPLPTTGRNVYELRARLDLTQWDCRRMWWYSSSLISTDDRRGTFLLVSSILMIRDESVIPTPPHNDNFEELQVRTGHPRGLWSKMRSHQPPTINIGDRIGNPLLLSILMIWDDFYLSMTATVSPYAIFI